MITSFEISNFKSFKEEKIKNCGWLNVVVGDNGSGKTALLEALFLAAGASPELAARTRHWRGSDSLNLSGNIEDVEESLWGDLFYHFDFTVRPKIVLHGSGEENRSLTITHRKGSKAKLLTPTRENKRTAASVDRQKEMVRFDYHVDGRGDWTAKIKIEDGKIVYDNPNGGAHIKAAFLSANRAVSGSELAARYSKLSISLEDRQFVDALKEHFDNIEDISLDLFSGNALLFARVKGLDTKIPLGSVSGGMFKLANILLAISEQKGGIVIVDEIENGFYYERLPGIWRAVMTFAKKYDCQLFISTHSDECLRALQSTITEKEIEEFCFLRVIREETKSKVQRFEGQRILRAVERGIEVR